MINKLLDEPYISNWSAIWSDILPTKTAYHIFKVRNGEWSRIAGLLIEGNTFGSQIVISDLSVVSGDISYGKLKESRNIKDVVEENLVVIEKEVLKIIFREFFDRTANMKLVTEFENLSITAKSKRIGFSSYALSRDLTELIKHYRTLKAQK